MEWVQVQSIKNKAQDSARWPMPAHEAEIPSGSGSESNTIIAPLGAVCSAFCAQAPCLLLDPTDGY